MLADYTDIIAQTATTFKLNAKVLTAQIQVESAGNTFAWKPEPAYKYLWDVKLHRPYRALSNDEISSEHPPVDFPCLAGDRHQEWWAQQASWGLLQIMGAVAREHGFDGAYLVELCDPVVGLTYGGAHLSALLDWAKGNITQALCAYNGGKGGNLIAPYRNQAYATKVLSLVQ